MAVANGYGSDYCQFPDGLSRQYIFRLVVYVTSEQD